MERLRVEYVPIDSIKTYKNNAKIHTAEQIEQIKESIKDFGMNDPISIWNDTIVEGHGRLIACKELGFDEVPIIRLDDLTDEQRRAYMNVHNKLTMNTGFDEDLLNQELENIFSFDMSKFGFLTEEEEKLLNGDETEEPPEVEFSEIIGEEHNYLVLFFDNDVDWIQAQTLFDIKPVKCGSTRDDGKITEKMVRKGIGRVLDGAKALERIMGGFS